MSLYKFVSYVHMHYMKLSLNYCVIKSNQQRWCYHFYSSFGICGSCKPLCHSYVESLASGTW